MELNNVTENIIIGKSNIATGNQGKKKRLQRIQYESLAHAFFRLRKMCMCQIRMIETQVGIGKFS